jgi:hypothetical protein
VGDVLALPTLATVSAGGAAFGALVALHALCALAGFGSIGFAGTYASRAAHLPAMPAAAPGADEAAPDPETEEITRYFSRPARFWKAVVAVPVLGALALAVQPDGKGFGQAWVISAFVVWFVATGVASGLVVPALGRMRELLSGAPAAPGVPPAPGAPPASGGAEPALPGAPTPARAALAHAGGLASRGAAVCDVLFFVALALMIWQP